MDAIADWTARERPDDAPATTAVTRLLRAAAHLEPELEETLAEHRLSRPSFEVLAALHEAPNQSLTQRQVMTATRRTSGTMSVRLARRLVLGVDDAVQAVRGVRHEQREDGWAAGRALADGVQQGGRGGRLVGDDEDAGRGAAG